MLVIETLLNLSWNLMCGEVFLCISSVLFLGVFAELLNLIISQIRFVGNIVSQSE